MLPALSRIGADFLVILHLAFIIFVLLGGLLVLWRRPVLYLHLPAMLWGALVECQGWYCPLTPAEQYLRQLHGAPYRNSFVEQYLIPLIYPATLTRGMQILFGLTVIGVNAVIYACLIRRHLKQREGEAGR